MDLKEVGHTIQLAGVVYNSDKEKKSYFLVLPEDTIYKNPEIVYMTNDEWVEFFWQSDTLETDIMAPQGKIIVRKTQRQISQNISWEVFRRDEYTCRYCGKNDVPLTVDHVILWEDGGPSIKENLVTSCKKCNRTRGNMKYREWLESPEYAKLSRKALVKHVEMNYDLLGVLKAIPISFKKMRGNKR